MDVSKYTEPAANFLKAADVVANPNNLFVVTEEGKFKISERFGNERLHLPGEFGSEAKLFDCSKTNARTIEKVLGTDTAKWVGKTLVLEIYKTKTSDGKLVDAINVKEVRV